MVIEYKRKLTSLLLIAILSFAGAIAINIASTSIANAAGLDLTVSDTKKFNSASNNNSVGVIPPSGGGNKGALQPKPIPKSCSVGSTNSLGNIGEDPLPGGYNWTPWRSGCVKKYLEEAEFLPPPTGCPPSKKDGITREAVGMMYVKRKNLLTVVQTNKVSSSNQAFYTYVEGARTGTCVYPKVTSTGASKRCAISATGQLNRLANSRAGAAKLRTYKKTFTTIAKLESGNGDCEQSPSMSFNTNLPSTPNNWGQYEMSGKISYAQCTKKVTTFDGKKTVHWACGNPQTGAAVKAHGTMWCGGVRQKLIYGKTWTMNDCSKDGKPLGEGGYTCTVPKATFDSKTGTVQTLRDGKSRVLNWGAPKVGSSVRNTSGWEQTVTISGGSSPRNTSVSDNNKSRQYFWSNVPFSKSWSPKKNSQNLAFYNASNPNGTWKATKNLRFDAQFKTIVGDITSYNPFTGKITTKNRTVWVKDYNIKCQSATSPSIQVLRSIGDVQ